MRSIKSQMSKNIMKSLFCRLVRCAPTTQPPSQSASQSVVPLGRFGYGLVYVQLLANACLAFIYAGPSGCFGLLLLIVLPTNTKYTQRKYREKLKFEQNKPFLNLKT